jgi:hypothetical protein
MANSPRDQVDLLLHIERLAEDLNKRMSEHSRFALRRYPITFAILALFGVVAVSEGLKGFLERVTLLHENPSYMLILGLLILTILGLVYKRLDK